MRRALAALAATLLALAAGCDGGTRLEVTVTPSAALDGGVLAAVMTLQVDVYGDETARHDYPVTIPLRTQRFVYHPLATSKKLLVHVTALDIMGVRRAAGQAEVSVHGGSVPVSIKLDYTTPVTVTPDRAAVPAGGTLQLSANVPVHWSVTEPDGGSIDANGLYRAPTQGGVHHVVATSAADVGAQATVAITGEVLKLLAGQLGGGSGMADGTGNAARFYLPSAVTNDNHGNLFVGDACALRRVSLVTGTVATVAGGPCGSIVDGVAADARFGNIITSVAADSAGNVYIIDSNHGGYVLRKLTAATNRISSVAGGGPAGSDGTHAGAGFLSPQSLVVHPDGNIYVADLCALRRVTPDGNVGTVVGSDDDCQQLDGPVADARLAYVTSVAVDPTNGDFYVGDDSTIRRIAYPSFTVATVAGVEGTLGNTDGIGTAALFTSPTGMAFDGNHALYVTDSDSNLVRRISVPDYTVTTFAGGIPGRLDGVGVAGQLAAPWAVTWDAVSGSLYLTEATNNDVRQLNVATRRVTAFVGNPGNYGYSDGVGPQASFWSPIAVAEGTPGTLYVLDTLNAIIRQVDEKTGRVDTIAGLPLQSGEVDGTGSLARFGLGAAVAADRLGHVYIGDANRVRLLDAGTHVVTTLAGSHTAGCAPGVGANARFRYLMGAALGEGHSLYLADRNCETIDRLDLDSGAVSIVVGAASQAGHVDGTGAAARITGPVGLVYDGYHALYFGDSTAVRKYDITTDQVTTIAGSAMSGAADGIGSAALFSQVYGIAYDGRGTLYVADSDTIRTIDLATHAVRTWAGVRLPYSQVQLGPLPAILNAPAGLVYTADGSLVFADWQENAILIVPGPL